VPEYLVRWTDQYTDRDRYRIVAADTWRAALTTAEQQEAINSRTIRVMRLETETHVVQR